MNVFKRWQLDAIVRKIQAGLASRWFFAATIAFFVFQAAWIALSAAYPQAFDEDFHFGIIQIYSHHWLPFLQSQPVDGDPFGALARDPSYLYHYLMSFPYRFIALFVHGTIGQVVFLRLLNVMLFSAGLLLFYRVLLRIGASRTLANLCIFLMALIPIVPQVAGQINYDNLLVPLSALAILLAINVVDEFRAGKPSLWSLGLLLIVCLMTTVVKYEFLPIFLAIGLFLLMLAIRNFRGRWRQMTAFAWQSFRARAGWRQAALAAALIVSLGFFVQRDVINVLQYHNVAPDCAKVLTVKECSAYSVWIHDYQSHQAVVAGQIDNHMNPLFYLGEWFYWIWYRLFFAINGADHLFVNYPPLPLPAACFALLAIAGIVAVVVYRRKLFAGKPYHALFATIIAIYLAALISQGYLKYRHTGVLELMNGRYLLPILIPMFLLAGLGLQRAFRSRPRLRTILALLIVFCFLEGGGLLTFLTRSDDSWNLNNTTVHTVNNKARKVVSPFVIEGPKQYNTSIWFFN